MAAKKKKIIARKVNLDRELATALTDLNKLFTRKELSKKFKIKDRQVSEFKHYRKKRKQLPLKKRGEIFRCTLCLK